MMSLLSANNHPKTHYQTTITPFDINVATFQHDIITIDYQETFKYDFEDLSKNYDLINRDEIYEFIKLNIDSLNELNQILPLLNKYFPSEKFLLKFVPDYEFEELNQLVVYICGDISNFDVKWDLLNKLNDEINSFVSNLISVDLW